IVGGAPPPQRRALARYGLKLGLAFQIADDVLDLVGREDAVGKSLGTDLQQQKMTLPLIWHIRHSSHDGIERLRRLLHSPGPLPRQLLASELYASGAIAYARRRAEEFAGRAAAALGCLPRSVYSEVLETLAERVVHRDA
ncbi:MAG: polyprenyl synthetase family protein, partial [Gemmataceae bacterium]|nr:polyprenyl synthetase family protein [Gemmataceae bacterium]